MTNPSPETATAASPAADPPPALPAAPATVTAAELAAPLAGAMPAASEAAAPAAVIQAPVKPSPAPAARHEPAANAAALNARDKSGRKFDPAKHRVDARGNPCRDKNGLFYSKNLGRPAEILKARTEGPAAVPKPALAARLAAAPGAPGAPFAPGIAPTFADLGDGPPAPLSVAPLAPGEADPYGPIADSYIRLLWAPLIAAFGPDVKLEPEEHAALRAPGADILRSGKVKRLDPRLEFGAVFIGIMAGKITTKPTVRERWELMKVRAAQLWRRYVQRKEGAS